MGDVCVGSDSEDVTLLNLVFVTCLLQKYGVAEGRPLTDLKAMAKAAGEQCPAFTPSGGETLDEVWYLCICGLVSRLFH